MRQTSVKWSPGEPEATFATTSPQITLCCQLLHCRNIFQALIKALTRLVLLGTLSRNAGEGLYSDLALSSSPRTAGEGDRARRAWWVRVEPANWLGGAGRRGYRAGRLPCSNSAD